MQQAFARTRSKAARARACACISTPLENTSRFLGRGSRRLQISKKTPGRVQAPSGLIFYLFNLLVANAETIR